MNELCETLRSFGSRAFGQATPEGPNDTDPFDDPAGPRRPALPMGGFRMSELALAPNAAGTAVRRERSARRRMPLAVKLAAALVGLVVLVLLVNGAINMWLSYGRAKTAALQVQQEKAQAAAQRVAEFIAEIENQIGWTTRLEWSRVPLEQQRYDFTRLLRQVPAITELSFLDGRGKEQLKVSRLEPDSVGSGRDFSGEPRFAKAVAEKIWFGPVYFRRGSEPYMTIAIAHAGHDPGVTVAEVNLKLIWDVITAIHVGEKGYAFVVDGRGRLIAHPDLSLVLRDTDFSQLAQVKPALAEPASTMGAAPGEKAEIATAYEGGSVLTAHAAVPRVNWNVFVQLPLAEALAPVYASLLQTLALLGLGLLLALTIGGYLARRMVVPIRRLQEGAERLGGGDLSQRIDIRTGDEIETLADRFNQMAGRVQESYETLEAKVEARTKDLNESLQQQTATADVLKVISRSAFDLQPVLDTLVTSARNLSGADGSALLLLEGEVLVLKASLGNSPEWIEWRKANPQKLIRGVPSSRAALLGSIVHLPDVLEDPEFAFHASRKLADYRANLSVPLMREAQAIGVLTLTRIEPGPFSDRRVELVQTFADQAVIAIENARLFDDCRRKRAT
jgi:HAMP domain-containing protein